jgi:hypothetical protein
MGAGRPNEKSYAKIFASMVRNCFPVDPPSCSTTHTMHIDHYGKVTYNDLPDKLKAPQVYG